MSIGRKVLSISILSVGSTALAIQTAVLRPYHLELDASFSQRKELEHQDKKFFEF